MRIPPFLPAALLLAVALLAAIPLAPPLRAQRPTSPPEPGTPDRPPTEIVVVGVVTDGATRRGVPTALVRLVPLGPSEEVPSGDANVPALPARPDTLHLAPRESRTDAEGRYRIDGVRPGRHRLEVEALGYGPVSHDLVVAGASPMEIRIGLVPAALALAPVVVTSIRSPRLDHYGFYDRRARGLGTYLDRDQIERRLPSQVTDLFRTMAGVQVQPLARGSASLVTMRGGCLPDMVVDGVNLGSNLSIDDVLVWSDLEGVEVYRGAAAPLQYTRSGCGMVLFWTVDPATRRGNAPLSWRRVILAAGFVALGFLLTG